MLEFVMDERNKNEYEINEKTTYCLGNVEMFEYVKNNYKNIKFTHNTFMYAALNRNLENMNN